MQLLRRWICVWGLPHKSQLGKSRIFQGAKLLLFLREKIRAFLPKLKIFSGRVLVTKFQFFITLFQTCCWSGDVKLFYSFKFFIDVITSFWISLSRVDLAIFAFADLFTIPSFWMFFMAVIEKSYLMFLFLEDFKMFWAVIGLNLQMSLGSWQRWLTFPEIGILSHLQMYRFSLLYRFCTIQVFGKWYIVRSHLTLL